MKGQIVFLCFSYFMWK